MNRTRQIAGVVSAVLLLVAAALVVRAYNSRNSKPSIADEKKTDTQKNESKLSEIKTDKDKK